jgi:hypothetical protein
MPPCQKRYKNDDDRDWTTRTAHAPTTSSIVVPIAPPPVPSSSQSSENDGLRLNLERARLEMERRKIELEMKRVELETKRIDEELAHRSASSDDVAQSSSGKASGVGTSCKLMGAGDCGSVDIERELFQMIDVATSISAPQASAGRDSDVSTSRELIDAGDCRSIGIAAVLPSALNDSETSTPQQSTSPDDCEFDGAVDTDTEMRDSVNENKKCAKESKNSFQRMSNRRGAKQARPAETTIHQKHTAQKAGSKNEKRNLPKAGRKDSAIQRENSGHTSSREKGLMSRFTPEIVAHYLLARGERKVLVEWHAKSERSRNGAPDNNSLSPSWINHDDFLFPHLTKKYLTKELKKNSCNEEIELLTWIEDCEDRVQDLNLLCTIESDGNAIYNGDSDEDSEIDFCCYMCKCPTKSTRTRTIRHCGSELLSKYHRACCHGYQDVKEMESFVSPMGKRLLELSEDGDAVEDTTDPEPEHRNGSDVDQGASVIIVNGESEMFHRCLRTKQKRLAVVVCINAVGDSAAIALKGLGIRVEKMIHVEADKVAQHVIRSTHDFSYGETKADDQIKHIVGLYERFDDIAEDPDKFVEYNGPIGELLLHS